MTTSIQNKIFSNKELSFEDKLILSNLFGNLYNTKNKIVSIYLNSYNLDYILSNYKCIKLQKFEIEEKIIIDKNVNLTFLFVFLKDSNKMIEIYSKILEKIENFNDDNFFHTLKRSYKNEGIYLVSIY